ncbi:hypothetical protein ACRZ5O_13875 [Pseudomonas protegens]|uniref:hypothetical protein n=1 Tax=Pseudomonas protegens TaxID=380021 RepID=UPI0011866ACD|nr:hypothetical protein [Pseudomonas protegens]
MSEIVRALSAEREFHVMPSMLIKILGGLLILAMGGCSSPCFQQKKCGSWGPGSAISADQTFSEMIRLARATAARQDPITLDEVKQELVAVKLKVSQAADQKSGQRTAYQETALVGGASATVGQLASKTGLLNTGLGLALGALALDSFYAPATTLDTHEMALTSLRCVADVLDPLTEAARVQAASSALDDIKGAAQAAVPDSISRINDIFDRYRSLIRGQRPMAPSQADFKRYAEQYNKDSELKRSNIAGREEELLAAQRHYEQKKSLSNIQPLKEESESDLQKRQLAADNELKNAQTDLDNAIKARDQAVEQAAFISLKSDLEPCVKLIGS